MLRISDSRGLLGRRDFLRVGGLGLGGLSLANMLQASASGAAAGVRPVTGKSVIFLFLHGGPSQTETFDPKMDAPAGVRSATGEVETKLPGITFGSTFPQLAGLADKLAIVRSFRTGDAIHNIKPVVDKTTLGANMGSLFARVAGTNDPTTGMPLNAALFPRAVDSSTGPAVEQFGKFDSTGLLGSAYAPFIPGGSGSLQKDMELRLDPTRIDDRKTLLSGLDRIRRDTLFADPYLRAPGSARAYYDLLGDDEFVMIQGAPTSGVFALVHWTEQLPGRSTGALTKPR